MVQKIKENYKAPVLGGQGRLRELVEYSYDPTFRPPSTLLEL